MSLDPRGLDEFLSRIKTEFTDSDLIANPFLSLVKPTEENLKKYYVSKSESRFWFGMNTIGVIPRILLNILYSVAISMVKIRENHNWNVDRIKKSRNLYISHFTYAQSPQADDLFFGKNSQNPNDLVFYLNSTRENANSIQKSYSDLGKLNVIVNTKSLGLFQTIKLHGRQFHISLKLLLLAQSNSPYTFFQRRLLLKLSISQHSRQTMANLFTKARLIEVISNCDPENIILTIEGHAHEAMVTKLRDTNFPEVRLVGFQHAPIVPGQFSFYRLLKMFKSSDILLTTGSITKELIYKVLPSLQTRVLGSPKSIQITPQFKSLTTMNVLGAVEGTYESLQSFIIIFNKLSRLLPDFQFMLRLHPALSKDVAQELLKSLNKSVNLNVSTDTLINDLNNSHVTIFRSSAVALEGLAFASFPVHFDTEMDGLLNPLSQINYPKMEFSDPEKLAEFLKGWPLMRNNTPEFRLESSQVVRDYYFPMSDINLLID
jgi:hypothetical protein